MCSLCLVAGNIFYVVANKKFYRCAQCGAVFLDSKNYLSAQEEKKRYQLHNNDVEDSRYQQFTMPIVNYVQKNFEPSQNGLDFGCGTGPVITKLLSQAGFKLNLYDPFFCDDKDVLKTQYNFIICCEVIEHFYQVQKEFTLLKSLLKPGGALICMTDLFLDSTHFKTWYYKEDPTHVFFYHPNTFQWIKNKFGFLDLKIDQRLIVLKT